MIRKRPRSGFTLLEIIAALIIAATLALVSIHHLRMPSENGKQRSCDMTRELLQDHCDHYVETQGRLPSGDLRELETDRFAGDPLPVCPVTGQAYQVDRNGTVGCPTHESTR